MVTWEVTWGDTDGGHLGRSLGAVTWGSLGGSLGMVTIRHCGNATYVEIELTAFSKTKY